MTEERRLIINEQEWDYFVFRNMSFWHQWISNYGHFYCYKQWGMNVPIILLSITTEGIHTQVFKTPENKRRSDEDILRLFSTKKRINLLESRYKKFTNNLLNSLSACKKSLTVKNWKRFEKDYMIYTHGLALTATMGRAGLEALIKRIKEIGVEESEIPNLVSLITYPQIHTPLFNSTIDLLKIAGRIQNGSLKEGEISKELNWWLKKYSCIPVNFCDEPWSLPDAKKQLDDSLRKDCNQELRQLEKSHKEKVILAAKKIVEIKDEEISLLAFALQKTVYLNEYRKNIFSLVSLEMRPLFERIAKIAGSNSWSDCYYLLPEEIVDILNGELKSIQSIVPKRKVVAYYMDYKSGAELFLSEVETKKVLDFVSITNERQKEKSQQQQQEIKGFPASSGKTSGIVKVILSSKDFSKLKPGEILVTKMTSVDFVPIMERASAFITDEGGITSHAAIVAREMNKPCIIGTGNATRVLKDGDLIEVDAIKGTVKKLQ